MIYHISDIGDSKVNEDILGYNNNFYWVLDGATALTNKKVFDSASDSKYIVQSFSKFFYSNSSLSNNNRELISKSLLDIKSYIDTQKLKDLEYELQPSFAMALVHITNRELEIDLLSDCYVIIYSGNDIKVFTDERINRLDEKALSFEDRDMMREQFIKNRKLMNKKDGYYVGTFLDFPMDDIRKYSFFRENVKEVLICSDGFYKVFKLGVVSLKDFFDSKLELQDVVNKLRDYEKSIPDDGFKKTDNATCIKISFGAQYE